MPFACLNLATAYALGVGVAKSQKKSRYWKSRASQCSDLLRAA